MTNRQIMQQWPDLEIGQMVKIISDDSEHSGQKAKYIGTMNTIFGKAAKFKTVNNEISVIFSSSEVKAINTKTK